MSKMSEVQKNSPKKKYWEIAEFNKTNADYSPKKITPNSKINGVSNHTGGSSWNLSGTW
jgi:hypothetical protein